MKRLSTLLLVLLLSSAEALFGQGTTAPRNNTVPDAGGFLPFPKEISYQGLLTTSSGTPAADGVYDLQFDMFNVSGGGVSLWTETQTGVAVANGVFSVRLGSVTPMADLFYTAVYLEVAALNGPGIGGTVTFTPRTQLTAAAYALAPWFTQGYDIYYAPFIGNVMIGTDTADPVTKLLVKSHSRYAGRFETDTLGTVTHVIHAEAKYTGDSDVRAVYGRSVTQDFWGIGGEFVGGYRGVTGSVSPTGSSTYYGVYGSVSGGTGTNRGVSGFAANGTTNYGIFGQANVVPGSYAGYFNGRLRVFNTTGDSAAMFPADAVSAPEILDEAGFASNSPYNAVSLPAGTTDVCDSVSITIPADGYIVVDAGGTVDHSAHVNGTVDVTWINIGETSGETPSGISYQRGYTPAVAPSGPYNYNFHCHRVFQKTAGTYSFYLNARNAFGDNSHLINYKWIQAAYYPTSYGPVTTTEAGVSSSTRPDIDTEAGNMDPLTTNRTEVDLRTLELAALRSRAAAEAAEKLLLEAQLAKEREKEEMPDQR